MIEVCVKLDGVELIYCDIEKIPSATDTLLVMHDPRLRGDKDVPFLNEESKRMIVPIQRILYIEVLDVDAEDHFPKPWKDD